MVCTAPPQVWLRLVLHWHVFHPIHPITLQGLYYFLTHPLAALQFQQQARESFPSKESSFLAGAFAMLYICLVHQRRPMVSSTTIDRVARTIHQPTVPSSIQISTKSTRKASTLNLTHGDQDIHQALFFSLPPQIAARFFRQIILVPLAAGAIYISLTRVFDGYNRVEDVYMGWSIGVLMAMASTSRPQQNKRARALKAEREAAPEGDARRDSVEWLPRRFDEEVLCERSDHAEVFQDMF